MIPLPPRSTLFPYTTLFRSIEISISGVCLAPRRLSRQQPHLARGGSGAAGVLPLQRSEEHTSELQSHVNLVCRLLLEKKKKHSDLVTTYLHSFPNSSTCVRI